MGKNLLWNWQKSLGGIALPFPHETIYPAINHDLLVLNDCNLYDFHNH